jgi:hypothetical protein
LLFQNIKVRNNLSFIKKNITLHKRTIHNGKWFWDFASMQNIENQTFVISEYLVTNIRSVYYKMSEKELYNYLITSLKFPNRLIYMKKTTKSSFQIGK